VARGTLGARRSLVFDFAICRGRGCIVRRCAGLNPTWSPCGTTGHTTSELQSVAEATSRLSTSDWAILLRRTARSVGPPCPNCDLRIRGDHHIPGVIAVSAESRPSFCDGCGSAFPWATREERIYELENLLDEESIEEADRVVIQDQLRRLSDAALTEKDERQAWSVIGRRAGAALKNPSVVRVLEGLVTAGLRNQLGI
jgi:hypothetical protein